MHKIVQLEHLLWKRRVVGEHTDRIFINMESVCHGFHRDRTGLIRNDPVKLRKRKLLTERSVNQSHALKKCLYFG